MSVVDTPTNGAPQSEAERALVREQTPAAVRASAEQQATDLLAATTPRRISLTEARAARDEARGGKVPEIELDGRVFSLPAEMGADVLPAFGALADLDVTGDGLSSSGLELIDAAVDVLLGGQLEEIRAHARAGGRPLSLTDLFWFVEEGFTLYGVDLPESLASALS